MGFWTPCNRSPPGGRYAVEVIRAWLAILITVAAVGARAAEDTLRIQPDPDPGVQARLDAIAWAPGPFDVDVIREDDHRLVRFASPRPSGVAGQDRVALRWFAPDGVEHAPAVLVIHSLHPDRPIAQMVARGLAQQGVHAFVLQLPGFGHRRTDWTTHPGVTAVRHASQAVADARRARDAIVALPQVRGDRVALVGISLGGFVGAAAASLDRAFDPVFLIVAGADGVRVLEEGKKDAFLIARDLADRGLKGDALRAVLDPVDPMHLAHRLDPGRTWLFAAEFDTVVPRACSDLLARRIDLGPDHHRRLPGNHYTSMFVLPALVTFIAERIER